MYVWPTSWEECQLIPFFTASGALPPFIGIEATDRSGASPYKTSASEIFSILGQTPERRNLIAGLLSYREALRSIGIVDGYQLIDGSFTEDCETVRGRPPDDIDLVTYARLPVGPAEVLPFMQSNFGVFNPVLTKSRYSCHAFFIDLGKPPALLVEDTTYFFGLFSHQRVSALWKGMLKIPLVSDDAAVASIIAAGP